MKLYSKVTSSICRSHCGKYEEDLFKGIKHDPSYIFPLAGDIEKSPTGTLAEHLH